MIVAIGVGKRELKKTTRFQKRSIVKTKKEVFKMRL